MTTALAFTEATARRIVNERAAGYCELCARQGDSIHHRRKRSQGGTWAPSNLLRLCGNGTTGCHGRIEAQPRIAAILGLNVTTGHDPAYLTATCKPAGLYLARWLLGDDGSWDWGDDVTDERAALFRCIITDGGHR